MCRTGTMKVTSDVYANVYIDINIHIIGLFV